MRVKLFVLILAMVAVCAPVVQSGEVCGVPAQVTLFAGQHIDSGSVTVWNDAENLYIQYSTKDGWLLSETHLAVSLSLAGIPQNKGGNPQVGHFEYKTVHNPRVTEFTYTINLSTRSFVVGSVLFIAAHAVVVKVDSTGAVVQEETGWGNGTGFPGKNWSMYFNYTVQACECDELRFRTQTQGGWGTACNGNNPGCYRDANFAKAFPNGLVVGCSKFTLKLTSSAAVQGFLPQGGPAGSLSKNFVDPSGNVKTGAGVFAGQVVALTLSVTFDSFDPNFGADSGNLKDLVFQDPNNPSHPCNGLTVATILQQANSVLGGCGSSLKLSVGDLNDAVSRINENFVDGQHDEGYLRRP